MSTDTWAEGEPYERYVGRWSRLVAHRFLALLDPPGALEWLDVGCGTGALSATILAAADPKAMIGVDPSAGVLAAARALAALLRKAGLEAVATRPIDVPTVFRDFEDYWTPFLGGQGPAPGYWLRLPETQRTALRERLRAALPVDDSGRIALMARALAARGEVPAGARRAIGAEVGGR
jgi:SAM-dependent methyltransferase